MNRRLVALSVATALAVPTVVLTPLAASAADTAPVLASITPAVNGWSPSRVTAVFTATDPIECRVDADAWTPCVDGTISTPVLAHGAHTVSARTVVAATPGPELVVPFNVDAVAPTVAAPAKAARWTKARTVTAAWSAKDAQSGVASYQVGVQRINPGTAKAAWTYPAALNGITRPRATITAVRGENVCWIVRARDGVGTWGAWTSRRCTATLMDERVVPRSKGWTKKSSKKAFLGTYMQTKKDRSYFTLPRTTATEVAVVVTTCPTCGTVDVYVNGKLLDVVDTYSRKTRHGVVLTLKTKTKGKAVRIRVLAGTFNLVPVKIEGFGLYRA